MFDSLDEQMKHDDAEQGGKVQRIICWAGGLLAAILVLGGIYFGVRLME